MMRTGDCLVQLEWAEAENWRLCSATSARGASGKLEDENWRLINHSSSLRLIHHLSQHRPCPDGTVVKKSGGRAADKGHGHLFWLDSSRIGLPHVQHAGVGQ